MSGVEYPIASTQLRKRWRVVELGGLRCVCSSYLYWEVEMRAWEKKVCVWEGGRRVYCRLERGGKHEGSV